MSDHRAYNDTPNKTAEVGPSPLSGGSFPIKNTGTPVIDTDAANKAYVDSAGFQLPSPASIFTPFTSNTYGNPGTFFGNKSIDDQGNLQAYFGSTDTSGANNSSNVVLLTGDITGLASTGLPGFLTLQGGSVITGSGNGADIQANPGAADAGNPGNFVVTLPQNTAGTKGQFKLANVGTSAPAMGTGTLGNLPTGKSGDPAGYLQININGTTRVIPFW